MSKTAVYDASFLDFIFSSKWFKSALFTCVFAASNGFVRNLTNKPLIPAVTFWIFSWHQRAIDFHIKQNTFFLVGKLFDIVCRTSSVAQHQTVQECTVMCHWWYYGSSVLNRPIGNNVSVILRLSVNTVVQSFEHIFVPILIARIHCIPNFFPIIYFRFSVAFEAISSKRIVRRTSHIYS